MRDTLGAMNDCYDAKFLDDRHIELLGVPTEKYVVCKEEEQRRVVVCSKERSRSVQDYCYDSCDQVEL